MSTLSITYDTSGILRGPRLFERAVRGAMIEAANRTIAELRKIWPVDTGLSRDQFAPIVTAASAEEVAVVVSNLVAYAGDIHVSGMSGPLAQIVEPTYERNLAAVLAERADLINLAAVSEVLAPLNRGI